VARVWNPLRRRMEEREEVVVDVDDSDNPEGVYL
jgi:hypothetical protein